MEKLENLAVTFGVIALLTAMVSLVYVLSKPKTPGIVKRVEVLEQRVEVLEQKYDSLQRQIDFMVE